MASKAASQRRDYDQLWNVNLLRKRSPKNNGEMWDLTLYLILVYATSHIFSSLNIHIQKIIMISVYIFEDRLNSKSVNPF